MGFAFEGFLGSSFPQYDSFLKIHTDNNSIYRDLILFRGARSVIDPSIWRMHVLTEIVNWNLSTD
jgi:hypothetical protein